MSEIATTGSYRCLTVDQIPDIFSTTMLSRVLVSSVRAVYIKLNILLIDSMQMEAIVQWTEMVSSFLSLKSTTINLIINILSYSM